MRILLLGHTGMLGRKIMRRGLLDGHGFVVLDNRFTQDMVSDDAAIRRAVVQGHVDAVINCAGVIPERRITDAGMAYANAVLPHIVAAQATEVGVPMIHVSTDCVYGDAGNIGVPRPGPETFYGQTKAAGEPVDAINIRTSFVGPAHGLWPWLIEQSSQGNVVQGWDRALWSGSTVNEVAGALLVIAERGLPKMGFAPGAYNLATAKPISKFTLLKQLAAALHLDVRIDSVGVPAIDRSMQPDMELEPFNIALAEMLS